MDKYKKKSKKKKNKFIPNCGENLLDISEKITDNCKSIKRILGRNKRMQNSNEPEYLSQFSLQTFDSEGIPSATNDVYQTNDKNKLADLERQISYQEGWSQYDKGSMSYGIYPDNQLIHDNMVPYYSPKYGYGSNDLYNETVKNYKNELFTGNLKSTWKKKQEVAPLFAPAANSSFIYGTPIYSEKQRERYIPSRHRQNEKLFEEEWVTPGVNLGPYEKGTHGYQSMYRVPYKTVDELRGPAKPKITYEGRIIEGQKGQARPIQAPVIRYRPETYKTTTEDDLLPNASIVDGPKTRDNFIMKDTDRSKQHFEYTGGAYTSQESIGRNVPEHMREKCKFSQKQNFKLPKPLQKYAKNETQYNPNLQSYDLPFTARDQTIHSNHIGAAGRNGVIYASPMDIAKTTTKETTDNIPFVPSQVAPNTMRGTVQPMDIAKPTIKETTIENQLNPYAASLNTIQRVYYSDVAKATTKETTLDPVVPINAGIQNNIYTSWMDIAKETTKETTAQIPYQTIMTPIGQHQRTPSPQDIAKITMKESTVQIPYQTMVTPIDQHQRAPNPQDVVRTTTKESTIQIPYQTIVTPINQQQRAPNHSDIAKNTIKESTVQVPYQTMVTPINQQQSPTTLQDIAKTTNKETTIQTPWNTFITPVDQHQQPVSLQDIAKTTTKETTVQTPWNNFITPISQQQHAVNPQDSAKTTIRETTVQIPYQTVITPTGQQQRTPNPQDVARTTTKETTVVIPYQSNIQNNQIQGKAQTFSRTPLRTTTKEQTVIIPYQSYITAVNQQQRAPNPQDVAKPTLKEQTVQIPHNTHVIAVGQQQRAPDLQDLPKTTTKEQTVQIPYHTYTTPINQSTGKANTFNRIPPKTTVKETTIDNKHIGMVEKDINGKGYGYLAEKMDAPNTNRQFTGQEVYISPIGGNVNNRPYNDAYNAEINDNREKLQVYREPTTCNVNLGPDSANITVRVSNDNNCMPAPRIGYSVNNQLDRLKTETYMKSDSSTTLAKYLDDMVLEQLNTNPYHISYSGI